MWLIFPGNHFRSAKVLFFGLSFNNGTCVELLVSWGPTFHIRVNLCTIGYKVLLKYLVHHFVGRLLIISIIYIAVTIFQKPIALSLSFHNLTLLFSTSLWFSFVGLWYFLSLSVFSLLFCYLILFTCWNKQLLLSLFQACKIFGYVWLLCWKAALDSQSIGFNRHSYITIWLDLAQMIRRPSDVWFSNIFIALLVIFVLFHAEHDVIGILLGLECAFLDDLLFGVLE